MKHLFLALLLGAFLLPSQLQAKDDRAAAEHAEIVALMNRIETARALYWRNQDTYREASEKRWKQQQEHLKQKEEMKAALDELRGKQEILYSELARAKEEMLVHQQALESEDNAVREKVDLLKYLNQQVRDRIDDAAELNRSGFPVGAENRLSRLHALQGRAVQSVSSGTLKELLDMRISWLREASVISVGRENFLLQEGPAVTAQAITFGSCYGYGLTPDGNIFVLSRNSKVRDAEFEWSRVANADLEKRISIPIPVWMQQLRVEGAVPFDILQNDQSLSLLEGEQENAMQRFWQWARSGGAVMVPIVVLIFWALYLILNRILSYYITQKKDCRLMEKINGLIIREELDSALKSVERESGILAGLVRTSIGSHARCREDAEKSVEEYLLKEAPKLDKNLDTISVLAGAAPLLGLLGTVTGMIRLFEVITTVGTGDPKLMAGGIAEALVTTEAGLIVAIPLVLIHNWLRTRRNALISDAEFYSLQLLNRIWLARAKNPFFAHHPRGQAGGNGGTHAGICPESESPHVMNASIAERCSAESHGGEHA